MLFRRSPNREAGCRCVRLPYLGSDQTLFRRHGHRRFDPMPWRRSSAQSSLLQCSPGIGRVVQPGFAAVGHSDRDLPQR